ncbi:MAG: hypothetical protein PHN90_01005 [Methanothrix sp.]|jgi:hypothetical protein|nr:hypothetical protein [Methanothrix sp.]OPX79887.1 MAG: hypothetical protein A4E50_01779 [Methanosaeta sp. PtaB.Bin087]HNR57350.1 hypothetical protein [Methanothrix sp.]HPY72239.1 hypothetical protein [Methanothrix sp.]HQA62745.1 hypothetical protein [Methanothrix sp.]
MKMEVETEEMEIERAKRKRGRDPRGDADRRGLDMRQRVLVEKNA